MSETQKPAEGTEVVLTIGDKRRRGTVVLVSDVRHAVWVHIAVLGQNYLEVRKLDEIRLPDDPEGSSVVYRTGPITGKDYADAIDDLIRARDQAERIAIGEGWDGCAVCEDSDHHAGMCHHNPLVMARRYARIRHAFWTCFHCGAEFVDEDDAREHFGRTEDEVAKCIVQRAGFVNIASHIPAEDREARYDDDLVQAFVEDLRNGAVRETVRAALIQPRTIAAFELACTILYGETHAAENPEASAGG